MFGLLLRACMFFHTGLFLVLIIPATLSDNVTIQTKVGSQDNISLPNLSCQVNSGMKICESFGAREVVRGGKNCSCFCPQDASTFGFDGNACKCLPNSIAYGGCPKFSQIDHNVLQRNSTTKLFLPSKNCSLEVFYKENNGSWITVKNISGKITFSQTGMQNVSFVYIMTVSNSIDDFQGTLNNVIVKCPNQNSTCSLLKLPSKMTCPLLLSSTRAPISSTTPSNVTTSSTNTNPDSGTLSKGELAAIVVGCLVFVAIILVLLFLWIRRKRNQAIKNDRRESRQQMTNINQDVERRDSEPQPVVFSKPNRASTHRKESTNIAFEPDIESGSDGNYEDPDYDMPIDENHSIISDLINKIKRPLSVKKPIPKNNENKNNKPDNESDEYQVMETLEKPDNLENTAVYENTNGFDKNEPKPKPKQSMYKKILRNKFRKKDKKPEDQEIPKKEGGANMEPENLYENSEVIRDQAPRSSVHENRASFSNDISAEEEEGPPPPPRSTSLEKVLDQPKLRPIPSPRMTNKLPKIENETEYDPSELYENTRKGSYPTPSPRVKR